MASIKGRYARIEIPLNTAETGKELHITGDYLSIISITGEGTCEVKLDHRHSQTIDFREITGITGVFERLYFTTDGAGGICSMFVGSGMAIEVSPDLQKRQSGGVASTQLVTSNTDVNPCAVTALKLRDVTIFNSNGIYACYVGPYNPNVATFKSHAYLLLPHKTLKFSMVELSALADISYDGTHNVIIDIIGTFE